MILSWWRSLWNVCSLCWPTARSLKVTGLILWWWTWDQCLLWMFWRSCNTTNLTWCMKMSARSCRPTSRSRILLTCDCLVSADSILYIYFSFAEIAIKLTSSFGDLLGFLTLLSLLPALLLLLLWNKHELLLLPQRFLLGVFERGELDWSSASCLHTHLCPRWYFEFRLRISVFRFIAKPARTFGVFGGQLYFLLQLFFLELLGCFFDLGITCTWVGENRRVAVGHLNLRVKASAIDVNCRLSEIKTSIVHIDSASNRCLFEDSKLDASLFLNNFIFILLGFPLSFLNTLFDTYSSYLLRLLSVRLMNSVSTLFISNFSLKTSLTLSASTTQLVMGLTYYFFSTGMLEVSISFSSSLLLCILLTFLVVFGSFSSLNRIKITNWSRQGHH